MKGALPLLMVVLSVGNGSGVLSETMAPQADNVAIQLEKPMGETYDDPGLTYFKVFDGECTGGEIRMYNGNGDNDGTGDERAQKCGDACANKATPKHGSWTGFVALGFISNPTSGRCWCESPHSALCTRNTNSAYDRYDWGTSESCVEHTGITPPFENLKLTNGSDASPSWYEPYQNHVLDSSLLNIWHGGRYVDCNPASCDNPSVCGIPVCRGISKSGSGGSQYWANAPSKAYWQNAAKRSVCSGSCLVAEEHAQVVVSTFPSQTNVVDNPAETLYSDPMLATDAFPRQFLPGIRLGVYQAPLYPPGYIMNTPQATDATDTGSTDGSWITADQRYCNPLEWLVISKMAFAHTGLNNNKKAGVLLVKMSLCLKANCVANDTSCAPTKCYVTKQGKCLKFTTNVFPQYMSQVTVSHATDAADQFQLGNYGECNEKENNAARSVIAGN